jgi:hypothetical protein
MKIEAYLFAGVALFFLGTGILYTLWAQEPVGIAALTVAFLMASVVSFFFAVTYRRKGRRPEDRTEGEVRERFGRLDFFPPHSAYPVLTALGGAAAAVGVVYGLWLFLIGLGILAAGVFGLAFEFAARDS